MSDTLQDTIDRLDALMSGAFPADHPAMLDYAALRIAFKYTSKARVQGEPAPLPTIGKRPDEIFEWMAHLDLHMTEHDDRHARMALCAAWPHVKAYVERIERELVELHVEWARDLQAAVALRDCGNCHACLEGKVDERSLLPLTSTRMILCPTCGNKRCPKASDHRLACTGSNELGQPGSVYR